MEIKEMEKEYMKEKGMVKEHNKGRQKKKRRSKKGKKTQKENPKGVGGGGGGGGGEKGRKDSEESLITIREEGNKIRVKGGNEEKGGEKTSMKKVTVQVSNPDLPFQTPD